MGGRTGGRTVGGVADLRLRLDRDWGGAAGTGVATRILPPPAPGVDVADVAGISREETGMWTGACHLPGEIRRHRRGEIGAIEEEGTGGRCRVRGVRLGEEAPVLATTELSFLIFHLF